MRRIGSLVRDARRHRGLTQQQLADRLGTSQSAIARIEQGGQNLTLELLGRLSTALQSELINLGPTGPTHLRVLTGLGLDAELVAALYEVESDPAHNVFAEDAARTVTALRDAGLRIGVVSDIHVDIRPAFTAAGLTVDVFTLSFEQGVQKPDPAMFTRTLTALGLTPDETLMVGDRSRPDGAAVELGIPTLLLPPLAHPSDRRLHFVTALCGSERGPISHTR